MTRYIVEVNDRRISNENRQVTCPALHLGVESQHCELIRLISGMVCENSFQT